MWLLVYEFSDIFSYIEQVEQLTHLEFNGYGHLWDGVAHSFLAFFNSMNSINTLKVLTIDFYCTAMTPVIKQMKNLERLAVSMVGNMDNELNNMLSELPKLKLQNIHGAPE